MVEPTPQTAGAPASRPTAWERWRTPLLFVSFGFNLFLIGLMVGGLTQHGWRHDRQVARMIMAQQHQTGQMGRMGEMRGREGRGPMGLAGRQLPGPGLAAIREAIEDLPEDEQKKFNEAMAAQRPQMMKLQQELRQVRTTVNEAIRAEPFDKAKFQERLAAVRAKLQEIQTALHTGMAEAVSKLSAESRAQFAESLAQARMRRQ